MQPAADLTLSGRRVLVLGLGRFSGGVETARFLRAAGAEVTISDQGERLPLAAPAAEAEALGATVVFGPQQPALLRGMELVLASPAIPFDHPVLLAAWAQGLPVTTEMNLVLQSVRAPVYGITGTKGKSTTSSLVATLLSGMGHRVHFGGNIGRPLIAHLPSIQATDRVVLELSSFQLWWARQIERSPGVAVVTNLMPDHLDRHGSYDDYVAAKRALLDFQGPKDIAVLPGDDPALAAAGFLGAGQARRLWFGAGTPNVLRERTASLALGPVDLSALPLWGAHNRRNALCALSAVQEEAQASPSVLEAALAGVRALPHRLAGVATVGGVLYVDDSNATHPESTVQALEALDRPIVLIAGGKDKGADVQPLLAAARRRARALVGLGTTGPLLVDALAPHLRTVMARDIEHAVLTATQLAQPGDVVLLSPGYSSLDTFSSFAERGDRFAAAVHRLQAASQAATAGDPAAEPPR